MFESQKEIDNFVDGLGVFIDEKDVLYVRTSKTDCKKVDDIFINGVPFKAKDRLINHILNNSHPFLDMYITFREIDLSVFGEYDKRNKVIEKNKEQQKIIEDAPSHIKKHYRLIYFNRINKKFPKYWIYNIKEHTLTEYNETLLSESDKKKALTFQNKVIFNNIVDDKLENEYEEAYKDNLADFNKLKINKNY